MQYKNPANRELVLEGLRLAKRTDLIGYGKQCLLRPEKAKGQQAPKEQKPPYKKKAIRNIHKKKN